MTTVLGMGIGDLNPQQSKAATCGYWAEDEDSCPSADLGYEVKDTELGVGTDPKPASFTWSCTQVQHAGKICSRWALVQGSPNTGEFPIQVSPITGESMHVVLPDTLYDLPVQMVEEALSGSRLQEAPGMSSRPVSVS